MLHSLSKRFESGKTFERKLCSYDDSCNYEEFCITATSDNSKFPCSSYNSGDYTGALVELYRNGNLIARDSLMTETK